MYEYNADQFPLFISYEQARVKILNKLPQDMAPDLLKLHKAVAAADLSDFDAALDPALATCGIMAKKQDRKKDR